MAALALGIAGAAIGSFFGPLGASIGWALGAGLGGLISQKDQEGPRLTDLKIQNSSYGEVIAVGYGTIRIAGEVIWSTDMVETQHESGGKGGPEVTNYTYSVSFAVLLTGTSYIDGTGALVNRPITGINRIWADGRLIYGVGSPGNLYPMTIYYGDEDQLPDPTMEAIEGAGNVPAHRGTSYVVFNTLQLQEFGNRIPNLTFEVICDGAVMLELYSQWPVDYQYPIDSTPYSYPANLNGVEAQADGTILLHRHRSGNDYAPGGDDAVTYYQTRTYDLHGNLVDSAGPTSISWAAETTATELLGSINNGIVYHYFQGTYDCSAVGKGAFTVGNVFVWGGPDGGVRVTADMICAAATEDFAHTWSATIQWNVLSLPMYWAGNVYACGIGDIAGLSTTNKWIQRWSAPEGSVTALTPDLAYDLSAYTLDNAFGAFSVTVGDDGFLYCAISYFGGAFPDPGIIGGWGLKLIKFDRDLNFIEHWLSATLPSGQLPSPAFGSFVIYRNYMIAPHNTGDFDLDPSFILYKMENDGTLTWIDEIDIPDIPGTVSTKNGPLVSLGNGYAAFRGGILKFDGGGITLGEIVADVAKQCGYSDAQIDVTELTDEVRGYVLGSRMSGRSAIDALRPAYHFGAVESNQVVKFRKWKGEVDATIPDDDLGARPVAEDPVEPFETTRVPEAELPQQIDVVYINYGMDYQQGNQLRQREVTASELKVAVVTPIVLTDNEAIQIADVLLTNAWIERLKGRFQLPRKYAYLEPTDVVSIAGHAIRLVNKEEHGYTHIGFDGVAASTNVFVTAPPGGEPIGFVPQPVPVPNATRLELLDIPLINDYDFEISYYAAMAGQNAGAWPGASLYKSSDGGSSYATVAATTTNAAIGKASTALGDFDGGEIFDEVNTVTVTLAAGSPTLSSATRTGVLNGANMAVLDDEVLQYRDATLTGTRTYVLSGLLRGRRGTEWAMGEHIIDTIDKGLFVALPVLNVQGIYAELSQERLYKGVTTGQVVANAVAQPFTLMGVSMQPYAPAQLGGGRNGSGDITLNWVPRTRTYGTWVDYVDAPQADTDWYVVILYTDSTYATEATAFQVQDARTTTITAATQTTVFGGLEDPLYWGIQQIGGFLFGHEARGVT